MIKVTRLPLPLKEVSYLDSKTSIVIEQQGAPEFSIEKIWKSARQAKIMDSIFSQLQGMTVPSGKCMYCMASLGSDIEHFRPKTPFPAFAFQWTNLLLCCSDCGRLKGQKSPSIIPGFHPILTLLPKTRGCFWNLIRPLAISQQNSILLQMNFLKKEKKQQQFSGKLDFMHRLVYMQ